MKLLLLLTILLTALTAQAQNPKFEGFWEHSLPKFEGRKPFLLEAYTDERGQLQVQFLRYHFSYKPVLTSTRSNGSVVELTFKMVLITNEEDVSPYTLRYVLHPAAGGWDGEFIASWESKPQRVLLKPAQDTTPEPRSAAEALLWFSWVCEGSKASEQNGGTLEFEKDGNIKRSWPAQDSWKWEISGRKTFTEARIKNSSSTPPVLVPCEFNADFTQFRETSPDSSTIGKRAAPRTAQTRSSLPTRTGATNGPVPTQVGPNSNLPGSSNASGLPQDKSR